MRPALEEHPVNGLEDAPENGLSNGAAEQWEAPGGAGLAHSPVPVDFPVGGGHGVFREGQLVAHIMHYINNLWRADRNNFAATLNLICQRVPQLLQRVLQQNAAAPGSGLRAAGTGTRGAGRWVGIGGQGAGGPAAGTAQLLDRPLGYVNLPNGSSVSDSSIIFQHSENLEVRLSWPVTDLRLNYQ